MNKILAGFFLIGSASAFASNTNNYLGEYSLDKSSANSTKCAANLSVTKSENNWITILAQGTFQIHFNFSVNDINSGWQGWMDADVVGNRVLHSYDKIDIKATTTLDISRKTGAYLGFMDKWFGGNQLREHLILMKDSQRMVLKYKKEENSKRASYSCFYIEN